MQEIHKNDKKELDVLRSDIARIAEERTQLGKSLETSQKLNENQSVLFKLKLKERSLLLRELSNQLNLIKSEALRTDHVEKLNKARSRQVPYIEYTDEHMIRPSSVPSGLLSTRDNIQNPNDKKVNFDINVDNHFCLEV